MSGFMCYHRSIRRRNNLGQGHRSCWGPQFAMRDCPMCGAAVEVRL